MVHVITFTKSWQSDWWKWTAHCKCGKWLCWKQHQNIKTKSEIKSRVKRPSPQFARLNPRNW